MAQLFATLLLPLPLVLLIGLFGLAALLLGRRRLGGGCVAGSLVLLFLFSWQPFAGLLIAPLEQHHPPLVDPEQAADAEYILVLGAGHIPDPALPVSARLGPMAIARLGEGVRLQRALPESTLVLSGAGIRPTMAETKEELARAWGVERVATHNTPRTTYEEARVAARRFGEQPFILVTSASHMPRAVALFRARGLDPIPAPTQYMAPELQPEQFWTVRNLRPNGNALRTTERAIYEYLGLAWGRLRGIL